MIKNNCYLREDLAKYWHKDELFSIVPQIQGEIFRQKEGRRTLRFVLDGKTYFLKYHQGIGWAEIIKNLLQFRLPIISAKNEWLAIQLLEKSHLDSMQIAAYGERGWNPAWKESFLVTDELVDTMSLEHLGKQWRQTPPTFKTKLNLITKIAHISKKMHGSGLNHRDFYLCHFLLDKSFATTNTIEDQTRLFLIDLHRAQIRNKVPQRWLVKDIGSLYFSALNVALTQRDCFRFIKLYSGLSLREAMSKQRLFWDNVGKRAAKLRDNGKVE